MHLQAAHVMTYYCSYYYDAIISNRVSELRVVDLLDGLCEKMQDYTLQKVNKIMGPATSSFVARYISDIKSFSILNIMV